MTVAWYQVQWSASSSSFLKSFYPGAAEPLFPMTAKLQLWHPVTSLPFVLSSGWNKQVLQVSY